MTTLPAWHTRLAELATFAEALHALKAERYPALVEKGLVEARQADWDLRCWAAIAADWRFAATLSGAPGDLPRLAKIGAIAIAIARETGRAAPDAVAIERLETLRAAETTPVNPLICAETTLALRAQAKRKEVA